MDKTLAIIKPDAVKQGYTGKIYDRILQAGFKVLSCKLIKLSKKDAKTFYLVHKNRPFYNELTDFMSSGKCMLLVLQKENAVEAWRATIGATNPDDAKAGTIRNKFALNVQEIGGNFVIKMFDTLNIKTIQLLYILYLQYEEIYFYKPDTSRLSNSEKYIVCKGFTTLTEDIKNLMDKSYDDLNLFKLFVPQTFLNDIDNFNKLFIKNQIKNINEVIKIVTGNRHIQNKPKSKQITIANEWCQKYNLELNNDFIF